MEVPIARSYGYARRNGGFGESAPRRRFGGLALRRRSLPRGCCGPCRDACSELLDVRSDSAKSRSDAGNSCLKCPYGNPRQRSASSRPTTSSTVSSANPRLARSVQALSRVVSTGSEGFGALPLRRERGHCCLHLRLAEPLPRQPGRDGRVSPSPDRQGASAALRRSRVVDDAGASERRDGPVGISRRTPRVRSRSRKRRARDVAPRQRPRRQLQRLCSPGSRRGLAGAAGRARLPAPARSEERPRRERRASGFRRPPARRGRGGPAGRPSASGPPPSSSAALGRRGGRLRLDLALGARRRGQPSSRRRPSGEDARRRPRRARGSAWTARRIPSVTSGCSLRNAVAFWRPCPSRSSPKLK